VNILSLSLKAIFNSGFAMTITYWCYNNCIVRVYTYIFCLAHLDRVHTTDCVCLYFIFSCLECMQLHVAASQMYIFKLMFSSIRRRLLYSLYTREVTTCCTVYIQGKSPHMCLVRPLHEPQGVFAFLLHVALRKLQYLLIPFTRK